MYNEQDQDYTCVKPAFYLLGFVCLPVTVSLCDFMFSVLIDVIDVLCMCLCVSFFSIFMSLISLSCRDYSPMVSR